MSWSGCGPGAGGEICRLVEGMPLAILLAASWVEVLAPGEIAAQVRQGLDILAADMADLPERQRSMRAAFDFSWRLLSEREQQAFARLSVFRGGFTAEAAQAVAGADLRTLRALVRKSLVASTTDRAGLGDRRGLHARYDVHELLRQYGAARLAEAPGAAEEAGDRHCVYYAEFLRRHYEQIWRANLEELLARDRQLPRGVEVGHGPWQSRPDPRDLGDAWYRYPG